MNRLALVSLLLVLGLCGRCLAGVVHLKDGRTLEGELRWDGDTLVITARYGEIRVARAEVAGIEGEVQGGEPAAAPEEGVAQQRADLAADDVAGRLELAKQCLRQDLRATAAELLLEVLAQQPLHAEARHAIRAALHYRLQEGGWVPPEVRDGRWDVPYYGLRIPVPPGWELVDCQLQRPAGEEAPDLLLVRDRSWAEDLDADLRSRPVAFMSAYRKALHLHGCLCKDATLIPLGDRKAVLLEYFRERLGQQTHSYEVVFVQGGRLTGVEARTSVSRWAAVEGELKRLLESLEPLRPETPPSLAGVWNLEFPGEVERGGDPAAGYELLSSSQGGMSFMASFYSARTPLEPEDEIPSRIAEHRAKQEKSGLGDFLEQPRELQGVRGVQLSYRTRSEDGAEWQHVVWLLVDQGRVLELEAFGTAAHFDAARAERFLASLSR